MHKAIILKTLLAIVLLMGFTDACSRSAGDTALDTEQQLKQITQALLDAVGEGDKAVWDHYLVESCLYTAEDGRTLTKAELLAELKPLPPGYQGKLSLDNAQVRDYGDTAVITYDVLETLTIYGQRIDTRFHTTDTYIKQDGEWRMIASQVTVVPGDPEPVAIDPDLFDAYVGRYTLAPDVIYKVTQSDGELFIQRGDGKSQRLLPLDDHRFFRKGRRGEIIFVTNDEGVADKLILRRDNNDIVWRRLPDSPQGNSAKSGRR